MGSLFASEKKWAVSILCFDALFWLLMLFGCVIDSVSCHEGIGFAAVGYYAPFWLWKDAFGSNDGNLTYDIIKIGCVGTAFHLIIWLFVGFIIRKRAVSWSFSIIFSLALLVVIILLGNALT